MVACDGQVGNPHVEHGWQMIGLGVALRISTPCRSRIRCHVLFSVLISHCRVPTMCAVNFIYALCRLGSRSTTNIAV